MGKPDSSGVAVFVLAALFAVLSFIASWCYSTIDNQDHIFARATLWGIAGFVISLMILAQMCPDDESNDSNKDGEEK